MKLLSLFSTKRASPGTKKPSDNPMSTFAKELKSFLPFASKADSLKTHKTAIELLRNDRVYQCVDKIAKAVMSVNWYAEPDPDAKKSDIKKASDEKLAELNNLLNAPCNLTGAQLRYWLAYKLALEGKASFKVGIHNSEPNAIYPLPGTVSIETDSYGSIDQYVYSNGTTEGKLPSRDKAKNAEGRATKSFAFEVFNPDITLSTGKAANPLTAIDEPAEISRLLLDRAYDLADGTPNIKHIFYSRDSIPISDRDDVEEAIKNRETGSESQDGIAFFWGIDLNHISIDNNLADIQTKIPSDDMARRIAGVFGVPVALLNLAGVDGSKFANNYIESRQSFFEDTIIPGYLVPIQEAFTNNICPPGIRIRFDFDTIPALREKRISSFSSLKDVTFLTDAEKRELMGFPPLKEGETINNNLTKTAA